MNLESKFDFFVLFIIIIKLVFIISAVGHILLSLIDNTVLFNKIDPTLIYWKERTEFIFTICMAILLIYHFRPKKIIQVKEESALLFYLFGWILLITANWNIFIHEAPWYKKIVNALD